MTGTDTCRVECTSWPYRFAYGYVNRRAFGPLPSSPAQWRTLMASDAQCRAQGMRCRGLLRFSNPYQAYRGDPLGHLGRASVPRYRRSGERGARSQRHAAFGGEYPGSGARRPDRRNGRAFVFEDRTQKQSAPVRLPPFPSGMGLFMPAAPAAQGDAGLAEAARLRRREVTVDTERLARLATATRPVAAPALVLNLFDDVVLTAIVERRTPTFSGGHALSGRLQGIDSGTLTLVVNGAVVAGTVWTPAEAFRIRPAGPGRHVITQAGRPPGEGMHPWETKDSARTPSIRTEHGRGKTFAAVVVVGVALMTAFERRGRMCRYRAWIVLGLAAGMCACAGEARAQGSIAGDRAALEAFYHALDGPWRGTENWASEAPLGEWDGVTTDESGRVTEVDLSVDEPDTFAAFPRLRGPIPPELGNLTMLRKLDLGANRLRASIPAELAKLTKLEKLILGGERSGSSELEGPVPAWLGDLTQLKVLHLGGNDLSGPIPAELGDLTQLEVLHLGGNDLSGPIPAELGDLTQLEVLHLGGNDLSGSVPAELGQLTGLRSLRLYGNRLDGSIPASLGNLVNLEVLGVNDLSGAPRPGDAARLANLELLHSGRGRLRDATEVGIERFAGEAGQLIAVSVRSQGFDARIKILSPVGERLASAGAFADEFRVAWLPGNGEYRIEVASPMVRAGLERGCCSVSCGPSPRCDYEVDVRVVPVAAHVGYARRPLPGGRHGVCGPGASGARRARSSTSMRGFRLNCSRGFRHSCCCLALASSSVGNPTISTTCCV